MRAERIHNRVKSEVEGRRYQAARQEVMRWGNVPPITASLLPFIVSMTTPTSPIAPHWIARPDSGGTKNLISRFSLLYA